MVRSLALLLVGSFLCGAQVNIGIAADAPAKDEPLTKKTLVAWVAPASLTQRGGSALTIDNNRGAFDGIVFGELERQRWMPGSEMYHRVDRNQQAWPEEKTDADTLVQIAITYDDKQVTIYRNGQVYAKMTVAAASPAYGSDSTIVIGPRHLEVSGGGPFLGQVDDARIYATALTAQQLSDLKPNQIKSGDEPAPWAWWNFEDKEGKEQTGRFKFAKLTGGAKIEGGKLLLTDSKSGFLARATEIPAATVAVASGAAPPSTNPVDVVRAYREQLLNDPHRPGYHFVIPEGVAMPFDPNGAIFWKGRYHMFYIFQDKRGHNWGHFSSTDLCHWRAHPTGLIGGMFSGNCFINKEGKPTMCYHQVGQGNAMAVALDDDLNHWEKLPSNPITPSTKPGDPHHGKYRSWDPFGWLEGNNYYAIFGGQHPGIVKSEKLEGEWKYVGDLFAKAAPGIGLGEDVSCADFFKLGNKQMLLCISHRLGARYYLGEWKNEQFHPDFHEKMSWVDNSFFAPESLLDDRGRRIMWAWIFDHPGFKTKTNTGWSGTMSLPRVLTLNDAGALRMNPPAELDRLRYNEQTVAPMELAAGDEKVLKEVTGDSKELYVEIAPSEGAKQFGVVVRRSPDGAEQTTIFYDATDKKLKVDTRKSSAGEGAKVVEAGPCELAAGETLKLRVYLDKSVVEVFANDGKQAVMRRVYPTRKDSLGVAVFSQGGAAQVKKCTAWEMMPSNPY